jgi:tetratricopeptide (TPR) repeat protein
VRALVDRGVVLAQDGRYVLAADADEKVDLATLEAPASLQALLSARLDALPADERRLVQDASVCGISFAPEALVALGLPADRVDKLIAALVRKEIMRRDVDIRSPDRGQYRFVQTLVRAVAYDTLSPQDRKARHLQVARYQEEQPGAEDLAAVVAQHYLDARDCLPDAADAPALARQAAGWLERAAERAGRLGAPAQAMRHDQDALPLLTDASDIGRVAAAAARHAYNSGLPDLAVDFATRARTAFLDAGRPLDALAVAGVLGDALSGLGRCSEAIGLLQPMLDECAQVRRASPGDVAEQIDPEIVAARLPVELALARAHLWTGDWTGTRQHSEAALDLAEQTQDLRSVVRGMAGLGAVMFSIGRPYSGLSLMDAAVDLARREHLRGDEVTALNNAGVHRLLSDLPAALDRLREGARVAQEIGDRQGQVLITLNLLSGLWLHGAWEEADEVLAAHAEAGRSTGTLEATIDAVAALMAVARGQEPPVPMDRGVGTEDPIHLGFVQLHYAARAAAAGDTRGWFEHAQQSLRLMHTATGIDDDFHLTLPPAVESALVCHELDAADQALSLLRHQTTLVFQPYLAAQAKRLEALLLAARAEGNPEAVADREEAVARLREAADELGRFGAPYWQARTKLDLAGLLQRLGGTGENREQATTVAAQAISSFEALGSPVWAARARRLIAGT